MKFWQVTTRFYDTGKVTAKITKTVDADAIPENKEFNENICDTYEDWFDSYAKARAFVNEAKEA